MTLALRAKILFLSVAILFIAIGGSTFFGSILFTKEYSKALQGRTFAIGETLKSQLDGLLKSGTPIHGLVGFEEQCKQLVAAHSDLSYAMVVDLDGRILFHNAPSQHNRVLSDSGILRRIRSQKKVSQVYSMEGKEFYDFNIPVFGLSGEHIAAVRIGFPFQLISKKTGSMITRFVGVALVFFGVGIILLIVSLNFWVTKPLGKLITVIQRARQQRQGSAQAIEIDSKDELGQLASEFNQMMSRIKESEEKLRDYTRDLEVKAGESTAELKASNERLKQYIIERRNADGTLWESEKRYRTILESIEDGYYECDLAGNFTFFNDSLSRILGYPKLELVGMNNRQLSDKETAKRVYQAFNNVYRTGEPVKRIDGEIIRKEGTRRRVEASGSLIIDPEDRPVGFRGIIRDITERKRMEQALGETEEKYRTILESIEEGYYECDLSGNLSFFNDSLCRILGYPRDELMGRNNRQFTDEGTAKRVYQAFNKVYTTGKPAQAIHVGIVRKDGTKRTVEASATLMKDPEDQPTGFRGIIRDITSRRRMEEALRESEKKYRTILESIEDGYYEVDLAGNLTFFNDSLCRMYGYTRDELIGMNYRDYMSQVASKRVYEIFNSVYKTGDPTRILGHEFIKKEGSTIYVEVSVSLIRDPEGEPVGFRGIVRDISERKRMEDALLESEEKYRTILENIEDGYYEVDLKGNVNSFNKSMCRIVGYPDDELIGMNYRQYVDERYHKIAYETFNKVYTTGKPQAGFEHEVITKDGAKRHVECSVSLIKNAGDKPIGFRGIFRDTTERVEAEETLEREKEKFRVLVEESPLGVSLIGKDGRYQYLNPKFQEMFGYSLEDIPTGREWFRKAYPDQESRSGVISTWIKDQKELKLGEGQVRFFNVSCKDGSVKTINFLPVRMKTGGYFVIYEDITERKRLEEQLQQAQKMEAVGTLAGGIAHDFNNLLMAIQGNTSLMLFSINDEHPHYKMLKSIENQIRSGAKLTGQLLGYARKGQYEIKPIDLNQVVEETSEAFGRTKREITIHRELAEELFPVKADHNQIQQMLLNLYINAADAMPGGGTLFLKTTNMPYKDVKEKLYKAKLGDYVLVTVTDTGSGMEKETQARIFDPFFTTKGVGQGTGLGLASAYGIIKSHGGYIQVDSEKGHGTTFSIYLPVKGVKDQVAGARGDKQEELARGTETILLVDDEAMVLEVGVGLLKKLGYRVVEARNGKEAIEMYKANKDEVDLVILDMIMPQMGGGDVYDGLKEVNPDVKVLLSSGYSIDGEAREIMKRGCDGFIQKPFNIKELSGRIRQLLDKV